jgi:hypothetical protein
MRVRQTRFDLAAAWDLAWDLGDRFLSLGTVAGVADGSHGGVI